MSTVKNHTPDTPQSMLKSSWIVSLGVLTSRILGFVRDIIFANFLGTKEVAEAFFVAFRIPNIFRDLIGEGAANAAIVPVLSEHRHKNDAVQWQDLINAIMSWGLIILGGVTLLGMIAAPWIVHLMAPGFAANPAKFKLTVDLTRIMFPYLILIALTAFQMGILYTLRSFTTPAFGPCLLNVAMILSAWVACLFSWELAYVLAVGVLFGGVLQFWLQWQALRKRGVGWKKPNNWNHPGARQIAALLIPRIWGSAVYQMNIVVDTLCASLAVIVGAGGVAAIYYASRIIQFPLGVFGYALSSAALPALSSLAAQKDMKAFKYTLDFTVKRLLFVLMPSMVLLVFLAQPVIHIIFERGAFDAYSTKMTSDALRFFAIGIPFFGINRILAAAFYALQDTKTPVRIATICLVINAVLNVLLMFPMKISGIALASSIAGVANSWMLWTSLKKKLNPSQ